MAEPQEFYANHYMQLRGKTVNGIVFDGEGTYGLHFEDGTIAWILCDPEGNGPGFLEIKGDE